MHRPLGPVPPERARDPDVAGLARCPWLAALPADVLAALAEEAVRRRYAPGEALFRSGDPSERFWVIVSGRVQASWLSREGRELVAHVAGPGEAPGHLDVLDGKPREADAIAVDEVEALVLSATRVRAVLLGHPQALMRLAVDLADIVRILGEALADMALLSLPSRLAKLLLTQPASGPQVELALSQADLAAQLGVARQSLNRALSDLQRQGLVRVEDGGRTVVLLDRMALRRLAAGERAG